MLIQRFTNLLFMYIFFSAFLSFANAKSHQVLCFTSDINSSFCPKELNSTVLFNINSNIEERIYKVQDVIRKNVDGGEKYLVLMGEGFDATLLTVAQGNMLLDYRQYIRGLVLKNSEANYYDICKKSSLENDSSCKMLKTFQVSLEGKASYSELLKSFSPSFQVDLHTPKCVIIDKSKKRIQKWKKLFKENEITHLVLKKSVFKIEKWFPVKRSMKIQPKEIEFEAKYFGPLLRFHLWKILYKTKYEQVEKLNVSYGSDVLQKYDVFYKKTSKKNPLLIYVHGGGWTQGDKINFNNLCRQYADKGFTTVSINYRLMDLPSVGMKEMITDVKNAIEHVLANASNYFIDVNRTVIMAESAGAQLAYMATTKLSNKNHIKVAVYNSITSNLHLHSVKKQIRLSGIKEKEVRKKWLDDFSPLKNLQFYKTMTLGLHSIDDRVVPMKHLEDLEIYSVINFNNIESLWIKNASHPISPKNNAVQPSYMELDLEVYDFILKHIK